MLLGLKGNLFASYLKFNTFGGIITNESTTLN